MVFLKKLINAMIICSFHNKDCAISDKVDTDKAC